MIDFTTLKNFNRAKKYPRNTIIAKDTAGTGMVVILKGEAGVFANYVAQGKERIGTLGPGDFFGESALFLGKSSPAAAVALTDVIALPIGADEAQSFIHEEPDMAFELMKAICGRLNQVSAAYEKLAGRPWAQGAPAHAQAPAAMAPKPQETQPASAAPCPPQAKQAPQAQPAPAAAAQTP